MAELYRGTDGTYYDEVTLWNRLESGEWRSFCWDAETGEEWVETDRGELLALEPVDPEALPGWLTPERCEDGTVLRRTDD